MAGIQTSKITTDSADDLVIDPATGKVVKVTSALEVDNLKTATISTDAANDLTLDPATGKTVKITTDLEVSEIETSKITAPAANDLTLEPVAGKSVKVTTDLEVPAVTTASITSDAVSDLTIEPATGKKLKLANAAAANPGEIPISIDNATGELKKLDTSQLTELTDIDTGDWVVVQAGTARADDTAGTTVAGDLYKVDGENVGGGSKPIDPSPSDLTAQPSFEGGTGTATDPFILTPLTSSVVGGTVLSDQVIVIANQKSYSPVLFTDLSQDADQRFVQPGGTTDDNGSYSFQLVYKDEPDSTEGKVYTGVTKVGTASVYFSWDVTQVVADIQFGPTAAPTASPTTVNVAAENLYGTVDASWNGGNNVELTANDMVFSINGGTLDDSNKTISDGNTLTVGFVDADVLAATEGDTISGTVSSVDGTWTETFEMVKRVTPDAFTIASVEDFPVSSEANTQSKVLTGINAPTSVSAAGSSSDQLTTTTISINGAAPAASGTLLPGQTIQAFGTTGATNDTTFQGSYTVGGGANTFDVTTAEAGVGSIATPNIVSPADGASDQASPVTVTSSAYLPGDNGTPPGPHTSSTWEVYEAILGYEVVSTAVSSVGSTSAITSAVDHKGQKRIVFAGGKWVGIADTGKASSSTDGKNWTATPSDFGSLATRCLGYGAGRWVILGAISNHGFTSTDGTNWTQFVDPGSTDPSTGDQWSGVAYSGSVWAAVASSGTTMNSSDGVNWNIGASISGLDCQDMVYGNGKFVAIGRNGTNRIAYSTSGVSWTQTTGPGYVGWKRIKYLNGKFWVTGQSNSGQGVPTGLAYSTDGINWTQVSGGSLDGIGTPQDIDFDGSKYVVAGNTGTASSTDGVNWVTSATYRDGFTAIAIGFGSAVWVVSSSSSVNGMQWSTTGTIWRDDISIITLTDSSVKNSANSSTIPGITINGVFRNGSRIQDSGGSKSAVLLSDADDATSQLIVKDEMGTFANGDVVKVQGGQKTPTPPPSSDPPDSATYTQVVNAVDDTSNKTSLTLTSQIQEDKAYFVRVKYKDDGSTGEVLESSFSGFSKFDVPQPPVRKLNWYDGTFFHDNGYVGGQPFVRWGNNAFWVPTSSTADYAYMLWKSTNKVTFSDVSSTVPERFGGHGQLSGNGTIFWNGQPNAQYSTNGGSSWQSANLPTSLYGEAEVHWWEASKLWVALLLDDKGDYREIYTSTDVASGWTKVGKINFPNATRAPHVGFGDTKMLAVAVRDNMIPTYPFLLESVAYDTNMNVIAGSSNWDDSGFTWSTGISINDVHHMGGSTWIVGMSRASNQTSSGYFQTDDDGQNWRYIASPNLQFPDGGSTSGREWGRFFRVGNTTYAFGTDGSSSGGGKFFAAYTGDKGVTWNFDAGLVGAFPGTQSSMFGDIIASDEVDTIMLMGYYLDYGAADGRTLFYLRGSF